MIDKNAGIGYTVFSFAITMSRPSVVTSKPAIEGHFKTGQR
jgi:hypothetical protein